MGYNIGYWSEEATYGWLYKFSSKLLHIPSNGSRSLPFLMMFWDVSGYSYADIILRDISLSDYKFTNRSDSPI
jgi:hypothetical protein